MRQKLRQEAGRPTADRRVWGAALRELEAISWALNLARSRRPRRAAVQHSLDSAARCLSRRGARQAMIRSAMMTILYPEAEVFSAPVRHDEPRFVRRDDGLGTVTQPELAQHATDMGLHGLFRDHEAVRNLDV
jgi:hypothetical protein